jgi:hypothetical protein
MNEEQERLMRRAQQRVAAARPGTPTRDPLMQRPTGDDQPGDYQQDYDPHALVAGLARSAPQAGDMQHYDPRALVAGLARGAPQDGDFQHYDPETLLSGLAAGVAPTTPTPSSPAPQQSSVDPLMQRQSSAVDPLMQRDRLMQRAQERVAARRAVAAATTSTTAREM